MTTLSQMVDEVVAETAHPELRTALVDYLHQSIRELHFIDSNPPAPLKYPDNLFEDYVSATLDSGYVYPIPHPERFQQVEAIAFDDRGGTPVPMRFPSAASVWREQIDGDVFYYRTGTYLAMSGYGATGSMIKIGIYQFPRRMPYYTLQNAGVRPAVWDEETATFTYATTYDVDDTTRANALDLTTNWMIMRHKEVIKEGMRAKLYKRLSDLDRAKIAFSAYSSLKGQVWAEASNYMPGYSA